MYSGRVSWPQVEECHACNVANLQYFLGKEYCVSKKPKNVGTVLIEMQTVQQQLLQDENIFRV